MRTSVAVHRVLLLLLEQVVAPPLVQQLRQPCHVPCVPSRRAVVLQRRPLGRFEVAQNDRRVGVLLCACTRSGHCGPAQWRRRRWSRNALLSAGVGAGGDLNSWTLLDRVCMMMGWRDGAGAEGFRRVVEAGWRRCRGVSARRRRPVLVAGMGWRWPGASDGLLGACGLVHLCSWPGRCRASSCCVGLCACQVRVYRVLAVARDPASV